MRILTHLIGSALKDLFSAVGTAIMFAIIGAGATLLVSYATVGQWFPNIQTDVAAGVIAVLAAYAGATTVILRSISRTVLGATKAVEADVKTVA